MKKQIPEQAGSGATTKKKVITAVLFASALVIGGVALTMRPSAPAAPARLHVNTIPAKERAALTTRHPSVPDAAPSLAHAGTQAAPKAMPTFVAPSSSAPSTLTHAVAASVVVPTTSTVAAAPAASVAAAPTAMAKAGASPASDSATALIADVVAHQPSASQPMGRDAVEYQNEVWYGTRAALDRQEELLTRVERIAKLKSSIRKLMDDANGAAGVTLPPPVAASPHSTSTLSQVVLPGASATANAIAAPGDAGLDPLGDAGPQLVAVMSVGNYYQAVIRVSGSEYTVFQGDYAGKWRVATLNAHLAVLTSGGKTLRLTN